MRFDGGRMMLDDIPPMPITLYRYILKELLRQLVLATGALVVVMSVGYAVVPMSQGTLSAWSLLKLFFYLIPGMLSLSLPIAAAYSATMVYYRMTSDNEVTACAAGGVSYRSLLGPVVVLGVVLTATMFFLSNYVIPSFWQRVEMLAQQDLVKVAVRQLNQGRTVPLGGKAICYAEHAEINDAPPSRGGANGLDPYQRIAMSNVTVVRKDRQTGMILDDFSGQSAVIDLYRYNGRTYAMMKLVNAMVFNPNADESDTTVRVWSAEQSLGPYEMPLPFEQKPQFMSLDQLRAVRDDPDRNKRVRYDADQLRMILSNAQAIDHLAEKLAQPQGLDLSGHRSASYTLTAPRIESRDTGRLVLVGEEGRPVSIQESIRVTGPQTDRTEVRWYTSQNATLTLNRQEPNDEPRITIEMTNATVGSSQLNTPNQIAEARFPMLALNYPIAGNLRFRKTPDLIHDAETMAAPEIRQAVDRLRTRIERLGRDIAAAGHERAAMAVNTLLMMMLGAIMSMKLRDKVPLVIFFWCFLPAIVAMVAIAGGKNVLGSNDMGMVGGIIAIWAGVAGLGCVIGGVYNALRRN